MKNYNTPEALDILAVGFMAAFAEQQRRHGAPIPQVYVDVERALRESADALREASDRANSNFDQALLYMSERDHWRSRAEAAEGMVGAARAWAVRQGYPGTSDDNLYLDVLDGRDVPDGDLR